MENSKDLTSRFLVTTASEIMVNKDQPLLFLGQWCELYINQDIHENLDYIIADWHWDDQEKLLTDYLYLDELFERILPELTSALNQYHGLDKDHRYWRILLGPWLGYFIHIIFDRWETIRLTCEKYTINGSSASSITEDDLIPGDMQDFVQFVQQDFWNQALFTEILKKTTDIPCEKFNEFIQKCPFGLPDKSPEKQSKGIKKRVLEVVSSFLNLFVRDNDAFIYNTTLSRLNEINLQLSWRQIPQNWSLVKLAFADKYTRIKPLELKLNNSNQFEKFITEMIGRLIPKVYLERYTDLRRELNSLPWPKTPKFIFSSCALHDTMALAYIAEKAGAKCPLIYGQHGGVYGMARFSWAEDFEKSIADCYLTWGWQDNDRTTRPAGIFRLPKQWKNKCLGDDLLFVSLNSPRYNYRLSSETLSFFNSYFTNSYTFADSLNNQIRQKLLIRLSPVEYGWYQEKRWKDKFPDIRLDSGHTRMQQLMKHSRLIVYTYNSTGYLEAIAAGVPTIVFWDENVSPLRDSSKPYIESLRQVGIYHTSPQSAAEFINRNWDSIEEWWDSMEVVQAVTDFKEHFCRQPEKLLDVINSEIKSALEKKNESESAVHI